MMRWFLQQIYIHIATKLRYLLMGPKNAWFLFNVDTKGRVFDFSYDYDPSKTWLDDPMLGALFSQQNVGAVIEKVKWCKCRAPSEHEFLVVHLKESEPEEGKSARKSVVLIERNKDPYAGDNTGAGTHNGAHDAVADGGTDNALGPESAEEGLPLAGLQPVTSSPTGGSSSASLSSSQDTDLAPSSPGLQEQIWRDYLVFSRNGEDTFVRDREGAYDVGRTLDLASMTKRPAFASKLKRRTSAQREKFTLLQLTTLFHVVNYMEPDGGLAMYNPAWFSGAIYNLIKYLMKVPDKNETINRKVKLGSTGGGALPSFQGEFTLEDFVGYYETRWRMTEEKTKAIWGPAEEPIEDTEERAQKAEEDAQKAKERRLKAEEELFEIEEENKQLRAKLQMYERQSEGNQSTAAPATGRPN